MTCCTFFKVTELIVSILACIFTILTFFKSSNIWSLLKYDRKYKWNRKELEVLFSTLPFDCIDSFFASPDLIRDELWQGLKAVDLSTFQFIGKEKDTITYFINGLDNFCFIKNYKQTPSRHWKYEALSEKENFDTDKERQRIKNLYHKAAALKPYYNKVKKILLKYKVDIRELNRKAMEAYWKKRDELDSL